MGNLLREIDHCTDEVPPEAFLKAWCITQFILYLIGCSVLTMYHREHIQGAVRHALQFYMFVFFAEVIVVYAALNEQHLEKAESVDDKHYMNYRYLLTALWGLDEICLLIFIVLLLKIKHIENHMNMDYLTDE